MDRVLEEFSGLGIVPVVAVDDADDAVLLAEALKKGGLPCAEVTFRTAAAGEAIRRMTDRFPDMLIGAGTVLTPKQAEQAKEAGAKFIVSPGFNPAVVEWCLSHAAPVFPGCACPSDMERALSMGLSVVKFFPAEANGGLAAIQAMSAPYGRLKFMPTGGITEANLNRYLAFDRVIACGGSFMAGNGMIKKKDWDGITAKTKEAVAHMLGFTLKRVVLFASGEAEAKEAADQFAALLGEETAKQADSFLAGKFVEIEKKQNVRLAASDFGNRDQKRDAAGQIVIGTNDVTRAVYHLKQRGFCPEICRKETDTAVYAVGNIAGYTVCLEHV